MSQYINRLFSLLAIVLVALGANAQRITGSWEVLPAVGYTYSQVIDASNSTYALAGGSLFSLSNDGSEETYFYNSQNRLTGTGITGIDYNYKKGYLAVTYSSGNIDLIYDDGHSVNMPDIRDAILTTSHAINDVAFGPDRMIVATDFGIVVFDDNLHQVVESGLYNQKVDYVMVLDGELFIVTNSKILRSPLNERHTRLDKFTEVNGAWYKQLAVLSDNSYVILDNSNVLRKYQYDSATQQLSGAQISATPGGYLTESRNGAVLSTPSQMMFVNEQGILTTVDLPDELKNRNNFSTTDATSVWSQGNDGIAHYNIASATPTLLQQTYRPNALTTTYPFYLNWSKDGQRLYIGNICQSAYLPVTNNPQLAGNANGLNVPQTLDVLENGTFSDIAAEGTTSPYSNFATWQKKFNSTRIVGGVLAAVEDPLHPDTYYVPTGSSGVFAIKNGEQVANFYSTNSPMSSPGYPTRAYDVSFDKDGNMWVGYWANSKGRGLAMLPAAKRNGDLGALTKTDWVDVPMPEAYSGFYDAKNLFCEKSNIAFHTAIWSGLVVRDSKGTWANVNDDRIRHVTELVDENGTRLENQEIYCMAEDLNGQVWMGTMQGILVVENPAAAIEDGFRFKRPLVARNDGTVYGDYLLSSDYIYSLSVDHANRKWVGTSTSGLYLVSADGSEILEHFTAENSPLPSNFVLDVSVDPNSNKVYVATTEGVVVYNSFAAPAAEDYSEVYAFPNPVRPDYTGWITITGLMDNSLVKIADASGNVLHSGYSTGGTMVWDGTNASGERVRTGVYFVFASTSDDSNSQAVVTKIMVVN